MKWNWAGHVGRMNDNRWTYRITFWYTTNFKRKKGRQRARWSDDFNYFLKHKLYHRLTWERTEWERLRETFAQNLGLAL